jgi:hypothetical protein
MIGSPDVSSDCVPMFLDELTFSSTKAKSDGSQTLDSVGLACCHEDREGMRYQCGNSGRRGPRDSVGNIASQDMSLQFASSVEGKEGWVGSNPVSMQSDSQVE